MNKKQLEQLEELKGWLVNTIGEYGYTDDYYIETKDEEDYTNVSVKVIISEYKKEIRDFKEKIIYLYFEVYENEVQIVIHEDNTDKIDYLNYEELIWRQMFFQSSCNETN